MCTLIAGITLRPTCLAEAALRWVAFEVLLDVAAEEESVPALRPAFANGDSANASGVSGPFAQLIASAGAAKPTFLNMTVRMTTAEVDPRCH